MEVGTMNGKVDNRDGDETGKVFVGGLNWDTTHATLLRYFARYGEVIDCVVMKNQATGKSRGFGFVKYKDPCCVETVLASGPHILDGRQIDPKSCNPRSQNKGGKSAERNKNKIFLGGLPTNITETQIREHFETYGKVVDVVIMFDQERQKSRGFGFLSFESEESVDRVCQQQYIEVAGKKVECKRAEPRDAKVAAAVLPGMAGLTLGGLVPMNSAGSLGVHQMATLAGTPGLAYPGLQQQAGGVPGLAGGSSMTGMVGGTGLASAAGLPGWASLGADTETAMYPVQSSAALSTAQQASLASTAGYASPQVIETSGPERTVSGYVSSPSPQAQAGEAEKQYLFYSPQGAPHVDVQQESSQKELSNGIARGILGNYPQEASGYGPARVFAGCQEVKSYTAATTPYSASITYAAAPTLIPGMYGAAMAGAGYTGMALPLAAYGNDGPTQAAAAYTRAALASQAFHPYRRADDGR